MFQSLLFTNVLKNVFFTNVLSKSVFYVNSVYIDSSVFHAFAVRFFENMVNEDEDKELNVGDIVQVEGWYVWL